MTPQLQRAIHQASSLALSFLFFLEALHLILATDSILGPLICFAGSLGFHALFWHFRQKPVSRGLLIAVSVFLAVINLLLLITLREHFFIALLAIMLPVAVYSFWVPRWTAIIGLLFLTAVAILLISPSTQSAFHSLPTDLRFGAFLASLMAYCYSVALEFAIRRAIARGGSVASNVSPHSSIQPVMRGISYQLRTALSGMQGVLQSLKESVPLAPQRQEMLHNILDDAVTSLSDLADYLFFSADSDGKEKANQRFNLNERIKNRVEYAMQSSEMRGTVRYDFDPAIPQFVEGDPSFIDQAIERIVTGILREDLQRNESLQVYTLQMGGVQEDSLLVQIEIASGDLVILSPLNPDPAPITPGVTHFANLKIHRAAHGISVTFAVPLRKMGKEPEQRTITEGKHSISQETPNFIPSADRLASARVLLVEDNAINRRVMRLTLMGKVASIAYAVNGQEAVDMVKENEYDLVLMDVQMPVMDGLEATRRIRKMEEGTGRHLPIIALTAYALRGDREQCLEAGMDAYIAKPFQNETLLALMAQSLRKK